MCIYESRRSLLLQDMKRMDIAAALVTPSSDFLYLTGSSRQEAQRPVALVVTPQRCSLLLPDFECGNEPDLAASLEIIPYTDGQDIPALLASLLPASGSIAVGRQMRASLLLPLQAHCRNILWQDADALLAPMRRRKSAQEISIIETAQHIAERALSRLLSGPIIGRTERDISAQLKNLRLEEGFDAVSGDIIASGPNTALPHHINGDRIVQKGDVLMFDIGGQYHGYRADFTRAFAVGCMPDGFEDVYQTVLEAHYAGVNAAREGVPACEVDRAAREVIVRAGFGEYFTHRLGHGIGLDVHEHPFIMTSNSAPLECGNVFSCEPGVYLPGRFGVRIEDLLALEAGGVRSLNTLPKELQIL